MAKGNGTTRGQSSAGGFQGSGEGFRAERWMSDEGWREVLDELEADSYPMGWDDIDPDHRELALMQSGFSGLANNGADDIIFESTKEQMSRLVTDTLLNNWETNSWDMDYMLTVGYKDGSMRVNEEVVPTRAITERQSVKTQFGIVDKTLFGKNVAYVTFSTPFGANYWSARGDDTILKHTGYEKWTRGRGTKRRDYVQDDWI